MQNFNCLDYVYKHFQKIYVYAKYPRVVAFMARDNDIVSFNGISSIFSSAGLIKLMMYLKICQ